MSITFNLCAAGKNILYLPQQKTTKSSDNEQSAVQDKRFHRMESFWRLHRYWRAPWGGLLENPALVYLCLFPYIGLTYCDIHDSGFLDESEEIHLAEPPQSMGIVNQLIIAEIFLSISAVFNIDFIAGFKENKIFGQDFNA